MTSKMPPTLRDYFKPLKNFMSLFGIGLYDLPWSRTDDKVQINRLYISLHTIAINLVFVFATIFSYYALRKDSVVEMTSGVSTNIVAFMLNFARFNDLNVRNKVWLIIRTLNEIDFDVNTEILHKNRMENKREFSLYLSFVFRFLEWAEKSTTTTN